MNHSTSFFPTLGNALAFRSMILMGWFGLCGEAQAAMVTIGNAGNAADAITGYGAVDYIYQISKTEVTIAEFQASGVGNGNENHWGGVGANIPACEASLYEAMKYCNWLTSGNAYIGAYQFNGGGAYVGTDRTFRNPQGKLYVLPTENEWYKAAYFKPDASGYSLYANGTNTAPTTTQTRFNNSGTSPWTVATGTAEQNGTFDMMGNLWEWMETDSGLIRGGCFDNNETVLRASNRLAWPPTSEGWSIGFRVVAITTANPVIAGYVRHADASPMPNVQITAGTSLSTSTDANGAYSLEVPVGWSGTVTPANPGWIFKPASRTHVNLTANAPDGNFVVELAQATVLNLTCSGDTLSFGWPSAVGLRYQLQSSTDLLPDTWTDVGLPFTGTGTGGGLTTNLPSGPELKKFFRLRVLEN